MKAGEKEVKDFVIDVRLLAEAFGLTEDEIKARMRGGAMTSRCEAGVDEDSGRWRLTFRYGDRACRLIVDIAGNVLKSGSFPITPRPQKSGSV